jgi:hypothetical protein
VTAAVTSWYASCAAGILGIGLALADSGALRDGLTETARRADPEASATVLENAVTTTLFVVLGSAAALILLVGLWTAQLHGRRPWARWALLGTGLVTLLIADVAQSTVSGGADLDRIAFLVQAGLLLLAVVLTVLPPVRRWLRGEPDASGSAVAAG